MGLPDVLPALEPIVNAMSTEHERRLNENTSLIVISEACLGMGDKCFVIKSTHRFTIIYAQSFHST